MGGEEGWSWEEKEGWSWELGGEGGVELGGEGFESVPRLLLRVSPL